MPSQIEINAGPLPKNFAGFTLYRIYYGDHIVYLGRTMQPLQNRIRGHLFKKPMHREIDINQVTKIEYATFQSRADQFLMEIYLINLWKPPLNKDDKAFDALTITLPEVEWKLFTTHLWEKWKEEIAESDKEERLRRQAKIRVMELQGEMRRKRNSSEITEEQYYDFMDELAECKEQDDYRQLLRFGLEQVNVED